MPMKNPVHPGRVVRHDCLEPLGLSVTAGAKVLGVSRQTLTKVISGKSGVSAEMAIRLAKAFGSLAETWVRTQASYDLAGAARTKARSRSAGSTGRKSCMPIDHGKPMKKKIPTFRSDRAAAVFVDTADLSQYDLGGAQMIRFETKPKDKSINLRLPEELCEAVRARAGRAGLPYQRFIRLALERAISAPK